MSYVRTVRGYEALNVTVGDQSVKVDATPQEVSVAQADAIRDASDRYGIEVEFTDEAPDAKAVKASVNQLAPDLSRGISAMSGAGAPVLTRDNDPVLEEVAQAERDADPYTGWLKAELEAEADKRGVTVGGTGTVADLKTALAADDNQEK